MEEKRKIIEIYVTENKEEDSVSFEIEKCEDTEIANYTMKGLLIMFNEQKNLWGIDDGIEAQFKKIPEEK